MKQFVFIFLIILSTTASAQLFEAQVTDYGGLDSFPAVKSVIDQAVKDFQDKVNEKIPNGSPDRIMRGMGNATVLSGKPATSDYSSHMEKYIFGVALGGAIDREKPTGTDSDVSGVGVTPSGVIGANAYNLGIKDFANLDTKKMNLYIHYMKFGKYESLDPWIGRDAEIGIDTETIGFRMNYEWIQPEQHRNYDWGGVRLGWGYIYNESQFNFEHDLNRDFSFSGTQNLNGRVTGRPKYRVDVFSSSIPLEISTDITFLKFFTLFGGLAADINIGVAKGHVEGDTIVAPIVCTDSGAVCGGGTTFDLQVRGTANAKSTIDPLTARAFLGAQFNLPYVQIYGQVHQSIESELLGAGVGIRFVR